MALSGCSPTTGSEKIKQGINNLKTPSSLQLTLVVAILEIFLYTKQTLIPSVTVQRPLDITESFTKIFNRSLSARAINDGEQEKDGRGRELVHETLLGC